MGAQRSSSVARRAAAALWLLLSPSAAERSEFNQRELVAPRARRDEVLAAVTAWRAACRAHPDNVAFLYAAGHGLGAGVAEPGVLLLEDFGEDADDALLANALNMTTVHRNLAGSASGAPRRQFSFFDACRTRSAATLDRDLAQAPPAWDAKLRPTAESYPMYLAAAAGAEAYGIPRKGSLFWAALRQCLESDAVDVLDDGNWGVAAHDLLAPLKRRLQSLGDDARVRTQATMLGEAGDAVIAACPPPPFDLHLSVVPDVAATSAFGTLRVDDLSRPEFERAPLAPPPYRQTVPSGLYELSVDIEPQTPGYRSRRMPSFLHPQRQRAVEVEVHDDGR